MKSLNYRITKWLPSSNLPWIKLEQRRLTLKGWNTRVRRKAHVNNESKKTEMLFALQRFPLNK